MVFLAGKNTSPGANKTYMECLLEGTSRQVKKGGVRLMRATRTGDLLVTDMPTKPTVLNANNNHFYLKKYNIRIKR